MNTTTNLTEYERYNAEQEKRWAFVKRFIAWFERHGWTMPDNIGGIFAVAVLFSPCGKYVAKFADLQSQDGWPDYARWAIRQNSPHVPKFYTLRTIRHDWLLTITERLDHLPMSCYFDLDYPEYSESFSDEDRNAMVEARLFDSACRQAYFEANEGKRTNWQKHACHIMNGTLRGFLFALVEQFGGFACDTHEGNMMIRRTPRGPVVVANDPYGYRRGLQ